MPRFLIADDHAIVIAGLRQLLLQQYPTAVVEEVGDAETLFKKIMEKEWDLVITDFNMPNMNGAELIKKVRSLDSYSFLPILLLTTEVRQEKIQQAIDGNITAFIKKPFDTTEFVKIVKKALR